MIYIVWLALVGVGGWVLSRLFDRVADWLEWRFT